MNGKRWKIDEHTELFQHEDGFRIRWAGAFFGPEKDLTKLVKDDLLTRCLEALELPAVFCDLGIADTPLGDPITFCV